MKAYRFMSALGVTAALAFGVAACGDDDESGSSTTGGENLSGEIQIDGSSTVFPFAQAAAEAFRGENPDVNVTVGESGTGGGFEKFCNGETDISDASRPIKDEEAEICKKNGIAYEEIQVVNDGIAVVTNPELKIDCMTTDQLKELWATDKVKNYSQITGGNFPDQDVSLYGPGTDSGTFDFFTDVINGEEGLTRKDYQPSEDDNVLVEGVSGDKGGLAYFGFSYYEANKDKLNLVKVDGGDGCVEPTLETIQDGTYKPLSRPIFMYPSAEALKEPQVKAFLDYISENYESIAETAQMVPMTAEQAADTKAKIESLASSGGGAETTTTG